MPTIKIRTATRNTRADVVTTDLGTNPKLKIYTAAYGTLLATFTWSGAFAPGASGGVLTYNSVSSTTTVAAGSAALGRYTTSADVMVMEDWGVTDSAGAGPIKLNQIGVSLSSGQTVSLTSGSATEGNA